MNETFYHWGPAALIVGGYIAGLYFQNRSIAHLDTRITDLGHSLEKRIDDTHQRIDALGRNTGQRIDALGRNTDQRIEDLKDFIHSEVSRLDNRLERLERAAVRP